MNDAVGTDARHTASSSPVLPIVGIAIAIAGTTTMDAAGLSDLSAFALLPLMTQIPETRSVSDLPSFESAKIRVICGHIFSVSATVFRSLSSANSLPKVFENPDSHARDPRLDRALKVPA